MTTALGYPGALYQYPHVSGMWATKIGGDDNRKTGMAAVKMSLYSVDGRIVDHGGSFAGDDLAIAKPHKVCKCPADIDAD